MKLKIAIAQIDIALGNSKHNQQTVAYYAEKAAEVNADVLVYPEMWNTGYALTELTNLADINGQDSQALLSKLAKKYHLNIVGGSVATQQNHKFYNTMFVFDASGQKVSEYNKLHLFGLMNEEKYMSAGSTVNTFDLAGIKSAAAICYDIRFPEWLRTMMSIGPQEILYVVAEWPIQRIEQWQIMLQARAIENQTFVVAANRVGRDKNNVFGGRSLIIDPLGRVVQQAGDTQETLLISTIDTDDEKMVRGQIPVFDDRRPELYY
ncbi:MAG: carbon-nitrogen family hydrolase [Leuconostoc gelidum]|jgi:omega-amidase|uniref:Carbon-nitrogen family hydrolase n=1 Tax=Leuconostoc gelidum subsp. gelidum TaxID=1607839 RepID=A0AB35FZA6_LEUGE|nr:carbon-nitrogen family hydrolase [Leuconostoc gelidum]MBZ5965107.1 carbon-nitrogen family hydrolase [Leuconostoc gelidum subsp. gelidum]MBZ5974328.1 carbon-nitrogen family hydrolase [Leuconostoc gelidum subsp. gelidum]MBZ5977167.1 carbon-nitrogen family hydrolase [Leuconostoc gelidum subsp. gelidum]MBZ5979541.1 carbon-nitrogen family hydrolase [Leuconostoc gelidum subsp. gelidum]MBZ5985655.1 carbon-nitrogen family hydrolase [Leuconostoc gelidum subsp. gelidum]